MHPIFMCCWFVCFFLSYISSALSLSFQLVRTTLNLSVVNLCPSPPSPSQVCVICSLMCMPFTSSRAFWRRQSHGHRPKASWKTSIRVINDLVINHPFDMQPNINLTSLCYHSVHVFQFCSPEYFTEVSC